MRNYTGICVLALVLSGCKTVDYSEPVSSYASSVASTSTIFAKYYTDQNLLARNHYLLTAKYNKLDIEVFRDVGGDQTETGLFMKYPIKSLWARMQALDVVRMYGVKLLAVLNSEDGEEAKKSIISIAESYNSSVEYLKKDPFGKGNQIAKAEVSLISSLTELYLNKKKTEAVTKAIEFGGPAIDIILQSLKSDIELLGFQNSTDYLADAKFISELYNKKNCLVPAAMKQNPSDFKKVMRKTDDICVDQAAIDNNMSESQRTEMLAQLAKSLTLYENAKLNPPDSVFTAMILANNDLTAYAKNPDAEGALGNIAASLAALNSTIQPFSEYYNAKLVGRQ